jgi:phosphonate transport system substrate-binding protein
MIARPSLASIHLRLAAVLIAAAAWTARGAEPRGYTLAVVPTMPAVTLHKAWTPFVQLLSKELDAPVELKLYEQLSSFLEESDAGRPDFLFTAPNMFFQSWVRQRWVPMVRGSRTLSGIVFVKKDSPYRTIADLQGRTIAFVGPRNLCSLITRQAMATSGTALDYNASFSGSTINVAKMVLIGKADAGVTLDASLALEAGEGMMKELRVILETPPYAPHPLAAHPRVPPAVREKVAAATLRLTETGEGRRLLADMRMGNPVRADFTRDYRRFEEVDFERLERDLQKASR